METLSKHQYVRQQWTQQQPHNVAKDSKWLQDFPVILNHQSLDEQAIWLHPLVKEQSDHLQLPHLLIKLCVIFTNVASLSIVFFVCVVGRCSPPEMTWTLKTTRDNVVKLHSIQTTLVYFLYLPCSWLVSGLTNYKQVFLKLNWNHSSAMFNSVNDLMWTVSVQTRCVSVSKSVHSELVCNQVKKCAMSHLGKTSGSLFSITHLVGKWNLKMFDFLFLLNKCLSIV